MLFLFLLCVFGIWMLWAYHYLLDKRDRTYDAFEQLDKALKKRYELITNIISAYKDSLYKEQSLVEYISKLRDEVTDLHLKPEFMNRRIALDKELENKSEELISTIKENPFLSSNQAVENVIKSYYELSNQISLVKQDYNYSAKVFRKAVDVFPTSFIARLNRIKSVDYIK